MKINGSFFRDRRNRRRGILFGASVGSLSWMVPNVIVKRGLGFVAMLLMAESQDERIIWVVVELHRPKQQIRDRIVLHLGEYQDRDEAEATFRERLAISATLRRVGSAAAECVQPAPEVRPIATKSC